jgi:hypothetical protein
MADKLIPDSEFKKQQEEIASTANPNSIENLNTKSELSDEAIEAAAHEYEMEKKYGNSPIKTGAINLASGLTFGLSNHVLKKLGFSQEELRELDDRNKAASIAGEVVGTGVGLIGTGGTGALAKGAGALGTGVKGVVKAGTVAEKATAKTLNKLIAETGEKKFAKEVIKKAIPKAAGSAVEGAAFGAGQLVKENALGTAEFNAENLVSAVGGGTLIGGGLGLGLGSVAPLFTPAAKIGAKVKSAATKRIADLSDVEDAAMDLIGLTPTQKINLKKFNPNLAKDLPEILANQGNLGKLTSTDDLYKNLMKVKDTSGKQIPVLLKKIDEAAAINPSILRNKQELFKPILQTLDDKYISVYGGKKAFRGQLSKVRQLRDDIRSISLGDETMNAGSLQKLRQQIDQLAKFEKTPGKTTMGEEAARDIRRGLRTAIDDVAERASKTDASLQTIAQELKQANRNFSTISQIEKPLMKKTMKSDQFASVKDLLLGGVIGSSVDFGVGALAVGVKKFAESDLRRKLSILSYMEKQNQKVQKTVNSSVKDFFKKAAKPVEVTTKAVLVRSMLSNKIEDGKEIKPKDRQQAFRNIRENLIELATDPEKLENRLIKSTAGLSRIAPETASSAQQILVRGVEFLLSKVPKEAYSAQGLAALQRDRQISDLELAKFSRYLEAVEKPMILLEDIQSGTATREQVEAVRIVYPDLYKRIVDQTYEYLDDSENKLSYTKKVQLGILLDIDADSSLRKDALMDLQQRFKTEEEKQAAAQEQSRKAASTFTAARADKIDIASRENSEAQSFARRRQQ